MQKGILQIFYAWAMQALNLGDLIWREKQITKYHLVISKAMEFVVSRNLIC